MYILVTFVLDHSRDMKSYGELWRATESYEELRRAIGRKVHITFKHDQTRATESYGELRRAVESNGSYGEQWFDILITFVLDHSRAM